MLGTVTAVASRCFILCHCDRCKPPRPLFPQALSHTWPWPLTSTSTRRSFSAFPRSALSSSPSSSSSTTRWASRSIVFVSHLGLFFLYRGWALAGWDISFPYPHVAALKSCSSTLLPCALRVHPRFPTFCVTACLYPTPQMSTLYTTKLNDDDTPLRTKRAGHERPVPAGDERVRRRLREPLHRLPHRPMARRQPPLLVTSRRGRKSREKYDMMHTKMAQKRNEAHACCCYFRFLRFRSNLPWTSYIGAMGSRSLASSAPCGCRR